MSAEPNPRTRRPILIVIRGKVGSGKSTLARGLAQQLGYARVDYDAEMLRTYQAYGSHVESVRDLARQDGRIAAGGLARVHLGEGKSVVCDADLRDTRELSELTGYDANTPIGEPTLLLRLEVSHDEARRRKLMSEWNEFRRDPHAAAIYFEQLWNYPFLPIEGEHSIDVDVKERETLLGEALALLQTLG